MRCTRRRRRCCSTASRWRADGEEIFRFVFAPARDDAEIAALRARYLSADGFADAATAYASYLDEGRGCLRIETPDPWLDDFANHWLPRQVYYHGDCNRLTTDPQTRNYLQDHMGMAYLRPATARAAFLHALSQQEPGGAMPDGILLVEGAELKYINQVPHADHCVWLPVCLQAYLDETGDDALLEETVTDREGDAASVAERIDRAMDWLLQARDARGLSYIAQGDWCDPMNMVGWKGRGVSGWLSLASAHALRLWAAVCARSGRAAQAARFEAGAEALNAAVNAHLWDGDWYGRGITDDGVVFGVRADSEGRIYLNPQSWAMLSGAADATRSARRLLAAVDAQLVVAVRRGHARSAVHRHARGHRPADPEIPRIGRERRGLQPRRRVLPAQPVQGRRSGSRLARAARDAARPGPGGLPAARPVAGVRAQLLPRRLAPASAHRRPLQPAVQHRHRGVAVSLPGGGTVRPARRRRSIAHRAAAALALAARARLAAVPRRRVRSGDRTRRRPHPDGRVAVDGRCAGRRCLRRHRGRASLRGPRGAAGEAGPA